VKVLLRLEHAAAADVQEALQAILSGDAAITPLPKSSSIAIADHRAHVEQALSAVALLDSSPPGISVEEVTLEKTQPVSVAALLDSIKNTEKAAFGRTLPGTVVAHPSRRSVLILAPRDAVEAWRERVLRFDKAESLLERLQGWLEAIAMRCKDAKWREWAHVIWLSGR
jgi:type II secretory pathway component GspD/PulD (secretin)